ncbi:MAG: Gfo/Idh/MocA family oxidoreductase [Candidatus Hydrogenedentes bacterium]|nr:Gfo/Idh/MocA family oxidoreductase [Candidatus Hydrogenedentota bacterium]
MAMSRRQFLGSTATAVIVAGTMAKGKVYGANDRIRVCCIGIHGQGRSHISDLMKQEDAEVVALCDVDAKVLEARGKMVEGGTKKAPKLYKDIRDVMAAKDIDAVTTATPNHWHSLVAVWACQAGKDAYIEKPMSHSIYEGQQVVAAAAKHNRVVMHGTQCRSEGTLLRDMKLMHEGFIGEISHSRGFVYKNGNRGPIGFGKAGAPPENLDWKLWQGPSIDHDFLAKDDSGPGVVKQDGPGLYVHYNWHWCWEYGNGEIGNQGVHEMDVACWGHNRGLPVKVYSSGGRYWWKDQAETPNTMATVFTYEDGSIMTFEVRNQGSYREGTTKDGKEGDSCGNSFFGSKGYYVRGIGFFDYQNKPIAVDAPGGETKGKFGNWLNAIRTRKPEDNFASEKVAHISCAHIHTSNIAYRLGRSLEFDPKTEQFKDADANKLIKREYRKGFEVPQLA